MKIKNINLEFLGHAGFLITLPTGQKIAIDPYKISKNLPKADLILITHSHYDHCSIEDLRTLSQKGTTIVIPADAQSKIAKIDGIDMQIIEPGDEFVVGSVKIEAIPSYNIKKEYHAKREGWVGYILKYQDVVIYHAGDTDKIPEMRKLTGHGKKGKEFVCLLPVSGKYVMDSEEAADVASLLSPDLAIPMHYGAGVAGTLEDAENFRELCTKINIHAEILEKI